MQRLVLLPRGDVPESDLDSREGIVNEDLRVAAMLDGRAVDPSQLGMLISEP